MRFAVSAACAWGLALAAAAGGAPEWARKVDAAVQRQAAAGATDFLVVLTARADLRGAAALPTRRARGAHVVDRLTQTAQHAQAPLIALCHARGWPCRAFWIVNLLRVRGDTAAVESLARRADVALLLPNPSVHFQAPFHASTLAAPAAAAGIEWNIAWVHAPELWALGYTGQGIVIGGQDTGYQWDHPALIGHYRGWDGTNADHNYNWHDAIHSNDVHNSGSNPCGYDLAAPCDDYGHGTHTMGTMVGDDGASNRIGMAPGAKWIGCRNMERGWGTPASYLECFQWFLAPTDLNGQNPRPDLAPDVINNSWYCPPEEGCLGTNVLQQLQDAIAAVRAAGIVVVASAGNSGPNCSTISYPPAMYDAAVAVGATDSSDNIAGFSSRGPVTADGSNRPKPDLAAPGVGIRSSVPVSTYQGGWSGTSMAGPHVAGAVALLLSAHPELSGRVDLIETLLERTAVPRTTTENCGGVPGSQVPNNTYGWGRLDALAALGNQDTDQDGLTDYQEIWAGTDPHDAASALQAGAVTAGGADVSVRFATVINRQYALERKDDLLAPAWTAVTNSLPGTGGVLQVPDPSAAGVTQRFYRIRVDY